MKAKLKVLGLFFLVLTSCIKDYYGGGGNGEDIVLTEDNYLYEGDLYTIYLNSEIAPIETRISKLKDLIDNNKATEADKLEYEAKQGSLNQLNTELNNINDLGQVLIGKPKPRPPCPQPRNCDFTLFEYIVVPSTVKEISLKILNDKDEQIGGGTLNDFKMLDDTQGLLSISNLSIPAYKGPIKIEVTVFEETGQDRFYSVE